MGVFFAGVLCTYVDLMAVIGLVRVMIDWIGYLTHVELLFVVPAIAAAAAALVCLLSVLHPQAS